MYKSLGNTRLDLKMLTFFFIALLLFSVLGGLGVMVLNDRQKQVSIKEETEKIDERLSSRGGAISSEIVHPEKLRDTLNQVRGELGLNSLWFDPSLTMEVPVLHGASEVELINGAVGLDSAGKHVGTLRYSVYIRHVKPNGQIFWFMLVFVLAFSVIALVTFSALLKHEIFDPLKNLILAIHPSLGREALDALPMSSWEFQQLKETMLGYAELLHKHKTEISRLATLAARTEVAMQVSHDIRSPLTALNMALNGKIEFTDECRQLAQRAVQRINAICTDLLQKGKSAKSQKPLAITKKHGLLLLQAEIEMIISEKRMELGDRRAIRLNVESTHRHPVFVRANASDFRRVISNLINNAIEAYPTREGEVTVRLIMGESEQICIEIEDFGVGIDEPTLSKLGEQQISVGKQGGSGLGIYAAGKTITEHGGRLKISSVVGKGSTVQIFLPVQAKPSWCATDVQLDKPTLVFLDDDPSVQSMWEMVLDRAKIDLSTYRILNFTKREDLRKHCREKKIDLRNSLFFVDHDLNDNANGLDLIAELSIRDCSYLVTNRYDDVSVQERCERLGVKQIPKPVISELSYLKINAEVPALIFSFASPKAFLAEATT